MWSCVTSAFPLAKPRWISNITATSYENHDSQFIWVKLKETSCLCCWPAARGIHRWAVDTPCRMHIARKTFLCHDVFMCSYALANWVIFASRNGLSPMQCHATAICFLDSQYIKIKLDLFYLTAAVEHIYIFVLCLCQKATLCLTIDDNSHADSIYLFPWYPIECIIKYVFLCNDIYNVTQMTDGVSPMNWTLESAWLSLETYTFNFKYKLSVSNWQWVGAIMNYTQSII